MLRRFVRHYGANPLHLLALIASFALAGYAARQLFASQTLKVAIWFVGAAVGHDLLLLPLYGIADASLVRVWRRRGKAVTTTVPWINYVRFPAAISGLLLLVFWPAIFRKSRIYSTTTDLSSRSYLSHWLLVTGILFAVSAFAYAVALRRVRRRR